MLDRLKSVFNVFWRKPSLGAPEYNTLEPLGDVASRSIELILLTAFTKTLKLKQSVIFGYSSFSIRHTNK